MNPPQGPADVRALLGDREWVRRVARAIARDDSAADDAEQEAWIAAMRAPPRDSGSVRAWFRSVLRRAVAQDDRAGRRRGARERAAARPESVPSTDEIVARAEAHRRVVEAVLSLDEPWRTTVVLRWFEEMPTTKIAERLGIPADTVRARLRRAIVLLRERLDDGDRGRSSWALLAAAPSPGSAGPASEFPIGGSLVAHAPAKSAAVAVFLLALLAGAAFVATRDDGGAGADGPAARTGTVTDADGASRPGTRRTARSAADETAGGATGLSAADGATVFGEVRLVAGDRPAEGAVVRLRGPAGEVRVVADAQGAFRTAPIAPGGPWTVAASAPGTADAVVAGLRVERGETRSVGTLWLDAPVTADVRVVTADGSPVAAARVEAHLGRDRIERQDWTGAPPEAASVTETGADGRARFASLGLGTWTFRATHDGLAPSSSRPETVLRGGVAVAVEIRMERGHPLEGRVTDASGAPVAGIAVLALPPVEATSLMVPRPVDARRVETRTDADGRYAFPALATGEHSIALVLAGTLPARVGVVSIPSVSRFDVKLDGATLRGRVTEEGTGRPIDGARVRAAVWRRHSPTFMSATTDADGRWSVVAPLGGILQGPARGEGDAEAQPVHFDVEKDGWIHAPESGPTPWRNVWVFGGRDAVLDTVMRPAASLDGTVTGPDGPVADAEVVADVWSALRGSISSRTTTGADGRFRFAGLPEGRARLLVTRDGYHQPSSPGSGWRRTPPSDDAVVAIPARGSVTKDVRLERGVTIRGTVRTSAGAPAAALTVVADADGEPERTVTTAADGAFVVPGVQPGNDVALRVSRNGSQLAERRVAAPQAGTASEPVEIVLPASAVVRGRVVADDGRVPPGAWVQVAPAALALDAAYEIVNVWQRAPRAIVAADGSFTADADLLGADRTKGVVVRAGAPGFAPQATDRLAIADGPTDAGTLRLAKGHRLAGRVVADDGSGPVANAEIEFQNEKLPTSWGQRRDWSAVGRDNMPFEVVARSGPDGTFVIDDLPPWRWELRVTAQGFGGAESVVAVPQDGDLTVELPRLTPVAGTVAWEDGTPAAQIAVIAHVAGSPGAVAGFTESAADGSFEIQFLAAGRYELEVRRPSDRVIDVLPHRTGPVDGGTRDVRIVVARGGDHISGRCVTPEGAAVPGAVLWFRPSSGGAPIPARSMPDGTFDASGLPPAESWNVSGAADRSVGPPSSFGRRIVCDPVDARPGTRDLRLEFRAAAPIRGRVVREDAAPLPSSLVVRARRNGDERSTQNAAVGADGAFALAGTTAGAWDLTVIDRETGRPLRTAGGSRVAGGAADVRLVVSTSAGFAGVVVDGAGRPVAGARVAALPRSGAPRETVADAEGRFAMTDVGEGTWTIVASDDDAGRATSDSLEPGAPDVTLRLAPREAVAARIVGADGSALRGAVVTLADTTGRVVARLRTDHDGRFSTRALEPGEYDVSVVPRDGDPPSPAGRVRQGAPDTVLRPQVPSGND